MNPEDKLPKVLAGGATHAEFIDALTAWFYELFATSTEGIEEAVARRAIWRFDNDLALVIGPLFSPALVHMTEEVSGETPIQFMPEELASSWSLKAYANGWGLKPYVDQVEDKRADPAVLADWLERLTSLFGKPTLILPWDWYWFGLVTEDGTYYYDDQFYGEDETNWHKVLFDIVSSIQSGELQKVSPWEIKVVEDMEHLPYHCDVSRYLRMIDKIKASKLLIVDLDQHCAGCTAGVEEWHAAQDPELAGKPVFRTFGQNSDLMYSGDGGVSLDVFIYDMDEETTDKFWKIVKEVELGGPNASVQTQLGGLEYESSVR